jgi:serine/threonine protein kinase
MFVSRFTREAIAQANVVHPNVVQVYFVGEERGVMFLAMQVVDGGSLQDLLVANIGRGVRRMAWQDAARSMLEVCEGLVVAEQFGIVHRDIKPANILIDKSGRALLSDFGLAASADIVEINLASEPPQTVSTPSLLPLASLTQVGSVMGTPEYVPPEQLKAGSPIDARTDIYALGATFFHLVTGKRPSSARSLPEAIARFMDGQRADYVRDVAPQVPHAFAAVLDRCLELNPDDRYSSMVALRAALLSVQPQQPVPASPTTRLGVWCVDVLPLLLAAGAFYQKAPWLCPPLFVLAGVGAALLRSTPGQRLMRLRLRTRNDLDVTRVHAGVRFLVQYGWYLPASIGLAALYASSDLDVLLLAAMGWLGIAALGGLGALTRGGRTLVDVATRTRLLVDTRWGAS